MLSRCRYENSRPFKTHYHGCGRSPELEGWNHGREGTERGGGGRKKKTEEGGKLMDEKEVEKKEGEEEEEEDEEKVEVE